MRRSLKIDKIVKAWAPNYGLNLQTIYKDENVRSIAVVDDSGNVYQIWIEQLKRGRVRVSSSNNLSGKKSKNWTRKTRISKLDRALDRAYDKVSDWIQKSGNSRNPI